MTQTLWASNLFSFEVLQVESFCRDPAQRPSDPISKSPERSSRRSIARVGPHALLESEYMDTQALVLQLRFSDWATRRVLASVAALSQEELHRNLGNSYGGVFETLAHIFQADAIWFDRLMGVPTENLSVYQPRADLAGLSEQWQALGDRYLSWAETLAPGDWDRIVPFRNTKGEFISQAVWRIVLHVVNHASYHRGQVTTMLRQLGREPVGTDLMLYYRSLPAEPEV
jgi:uncharacterized damage-inducible protein DinB